ncbi:hypothetical protein [Brevundimonas faecalis]|uniref:Rap1a immunity protein domain-containing protein n=1 Tax=Brevundimonas faecalis TaxID=947378 RepID=A0ABV2R8U2_9CAUL
MILAAMMATALLGADLTDLPAASQADLQCMGLLAVAIDDPALSDALRQQYSGGMMYYLGRLEGRDPQANWIRRMLDYTDNTPVQQVRSHSQRCGRELIAKGQEIFTLLDRVP